MVDSPHDKGVTFTIRSASVGYAAEYLTRGTVTAIPMGFPLLMYVNCILYHFPLLHVLHVLHGYHLLFSCISCISWFKSLRPLRSLRLNSSTCSTRLNIYQLLFCVFRVFCGYASLRTLRLCDSALNTLTRSIHSARSFRRGPSCRGQRRGRGWRRRGLEGQT